MAERSLNPYEPPGLTAAAGINATGDFAIGQALSEGWSAATHNFPLWLGVGIVATVLMFASALTIIGYFLVVPVLMYGSVKFLLRMLDGQAEFNDLFGGFSNYGKSLGRMLLLFTILIGIGLTSESVFFIGSFLDSAPLQVLGSLVYLGSFAFVLLPLSFSYFFVVDKDMTALDALSASWHITRGKRGSVLALALLASLVTLSGLLALLVGVVFTTTVGYAMFASAYRQMVGAAPASVPGVR